MPKSASPSAKPSAARLAPAELYRRAEALIPVLASRTERCEQLRACPAETIDDLAQAGLLQICRPARFGGYEHGWDVLTQVNRILARGCGSQAWVANVLNDHTQLVGAFALEAQDEVWGRDPNTRIAASVAPSGKARRVDGGARLSGRYGFSSGIDHVQWLLCGAILEQEGPQQEKRPPAWWDFLIPKSAVQVIDDWQVAGLRGTGSKSFVVEDLLVPPHRFQDHVHSDDGTGPGTKINTASVFRTPRASVAAQGFTGLAVGVAEAFLATYFAHTRARNGRGINVAEFGSTQMNLALATGQIEGAAAHLTATLRHWIDLMDAGGALTAQEKLKARFEAAFIARQCLNGVNALFAAAGGHSIFDSNPLQRQWRDLTAICTHRGLYLDESAPAYGKSALTTGQL